AEFAHRSLSTTSSLNAHEYGRPLRRTNYSTPPPLHAPYALAAARAFWLARACVAHPRNFVAPRGPHATSSGGCRRPSEFHPYQHLIENAVSLPRGRRGVEQIRGPAWRLRYPMRAWTSMTRSAFNGATPIAIANATMPSIRPTERFFDGFLLPASSTAITVLLAHIESTG